MKQGRPMRFLSVRVAWVLILLSILCLVTAGCFTAAVPDGAPVWPVSVILAGLLISWLIFYLYILRPYRRMERMTKLFLDGYTLSGIRDNGGTPVTPAGEMLFDRVKDEFKAPYLIKLSKRQAQYRTLQNQINPHFLYNTLESIRSEALIAGLDSVADMTEALAVFFRYTISKDENLVSAEEELQNCQTYFRIQKYRFGERLILNILCDSADRDEILRCRLPKLTLQPILENGIIHGTESRLGVGKLEVSLEKSGNRLSIRVSDNGAGMDSAAVARLNERLGKSGRALQDDQTDSGGGLALVNVNNRIHLLFGEEYGLNVCSMPDAGTDVYISLPVITSEREAVGRGMLG
jgi:two-component system sensor histidine kinase YesM